ncbi:MAG: VPLPA-CTERM sorting domain-containing protein [Pseudomonadota bacterium]
MNKLVSALALAGLSLTLAAPASALVVDTSLWTTTPDPWTNQTGQSWTTSGNTAEADSNDDGALISDFTLVGDFEYSGTVSNNGDNDTYGVVFQFADPSNHYRVGWCGSLSNSLCEDPDGAILAVESGGTTTLLDSQAVAWTSGTVYDFVVRKINDDITATFTAQGAAAPTVSLAATDGTFGSGSVGFYTHSQTADFSGLAGLREQELPENQVPLPAAAWMLLAGIGALGAAARRRRTA